MCRVIKMSDVMGAASDHMGQYGWVENWEGASLPEIDEMLEGAGVSSVVLDERGNVVAISTHPYAPSLNNGPCVDCGMSKWSKIHTQPKKRERVYLPLEESPTTVPVKPRKLIMGNRR